MYQLFKEHPHSFEIKHPDGSHFHVAKSAIHPSLMGKIKGLPRIKMADGGEVPDADVNSDMTDDQKKQLRDALTQVGQSDTASPSDSTSGSTDQNPSQDSSSATGNQNLDLSQLDKNSTDINDAPNNQVDSSQNNNSSDASRAPAGAPSQTQGVGFGSQAPKTQGSQFPQNPDYLSQFNKNIGMEKAGINERATAQSDESKEKADIYQNSVQKWQDLQKNYQSQMTQLNAENQQLTQDVVNTKIDPNRVWSQSSTGAKIGAAIGLLLSGVGSGLTGKPNMAMEVINNEINRDIDAQKMDLGKKENLLSMNLRKYGELNTATMATAAQLSSIVQGQVAATAAKYGSPESLANSKILIGNLNNEALQTRQKIAVQQSAFGMLNGGNNNGSRGPGSTGTGAQVDPAMKIRALGAAGIVPDKQQEVLYKDLKTAQDMTKNRDDLLANFDKVSKLQTIEGRGYSPFQSTNQIQALTEPVLAKLAHESEGRVTEKDVDYMRPLFPSLTDNAQTVALKKQQLNNYISSKLHFPSLDAYNLMPQGQFTKQGNNKITENQ